MSVFKTAKQEKQVPEIERLIEDTAVIFCPLIMAAGHSAGFDWSSDNCHCKKKRCAWWFGAQECCSLPAIANLLEEHNGRN
jgi:hypothetical protein